MIDTSSIPRLIGAPVLDRKHAKIGTIGQIYVDPKGRPVWASVRTGLFGTAQSFVPLESAHAEGDSLEVGFDKDTVKDAPRIEDDGELSRTDEETLYDYYSLDYSSMDEPSGDTDVRSTGHDTSGPNTDTAMTRSEERLHVGTEKQQAGTARLRKYVVTENESVTVPVSHEEVRLEREPITESNVGDAMRGGDITEEEHEVTLHKERPVVDKETVPVERVRLDKDTVTEQERVSDEVRKERIDLEGDRTTRDRTTRDRDKR